ncbi:MAG: hypothetical protein ACREV5_13180 [Steroidobacter sp.]
MSPRFVLNGIALLTVLLIGCDQQPASPASPPATIGADYALPTFVGKVWVSTTLGNPRGSIKIFLPDKSLLMDSCFETFRIAKWGIISDDTIRWVEDTIPIEAQYTQPTQNSLRLKISGKSQEETYVTASVPYVCPDMPR